MSEKAKILSFWIIRSDFYFIFQWAYVEAKKKKNQKSSFIHCELLI